MGDTAVYCRLSHDFKTHFLAEYVAETHNLTCTVLYMYRTTFKRQERCTFKDSHSKCFITTNSTAKLSPGEVNRREVL